MNDLNIDDIFDNFNEAFEHARDGLEDYKSAAVDEIHEIIKTAREGQEAAYSAFVEDNGPVSRASKFYSDCFLEIALGVTQHIPIQMYCVALMRSMTNR